MTEIAQIERKPATEVARLIAAHVATNGIRYASYGDTQLAPADLELIVLAVPPTIAAALDRKAYYFVPLVMGDGDETESKRSGASETLVAVDYTADLGEQATCHRNVVCDGIECVFISTRLMQDRFALAFEFYINTGHHFVDAVGVPESFAELVWSHAVAGVRGETSQDAWEQRAKARGRSSAPAFEQPWSRGPAVRSRSGMSQTARSRTEVADLDANAVDEKARTEYLEAAFADAIAIYLLSLTVDFDYTELREREYPLLAAPALAERLRHVAQLFPASAGQEFSIRYRRRNR
ncbi:MAG: hypothetical protein ACYDC6_13775 [Acidobacteriaceae bacterium]